MDKRLNRRFLRRLGVASFAEKALDVECLENWGQTEDLTTRLRSLLNGYKDGLSIFRETIQNADDAGASVVKYCYDMRRNDKWRNPLKLIIRAWCKRKDLLSLSTMMQRLAKMTLSTLFDSAVCPKATQPTKSENSVLALMLFIT